MCTLQETLELGRVPGTTSFASTRSGKPLFVYNGIVIFRFNGALFFGNDQKFKSKYTQPHRCSFSHTQFFALVLLLLLLFVVRIYAYLLEPARIERGLVVDMGAINFLDATGVHAIDEVHRAFALLFVLLTFWPSPPGQVVRQLAIQKPTPLVVVFAGANRKVMDKLRFAGLLKVIGSDHFYDTVQDALLALINKQVVIRAPTFAVISPPFSPFIC